jgi:hypothetical protein
MTTPICNPCLGIPCDNPPDLASGIDGAIYSALDYSFIVQCPPLCFCPAGVFPQTISILASTIHPVIPPIPETGLPIILRLQGCSALITRTLPFGSTQATIAAAAQSMQAEWAGQQALCNALLVPGVSCLAPASFVDVCNDAQNFVCPYNGLTVSNPAGLYCQRLSTIGLTPSQITTQIAAIKANLNNLAQTIGNCQFIHVVCSVVESFNGIPGGDVINLFCNNVGNTAFDSSGFQVCHPDGTGCSNSLHASTPPNTQILIQSVSSAFFATNGFSIKFNGFFLLVDNNSSTIDRQVVVTVGCGV